MSLHTETQKKHFDPARFLAGLPQRPGVYKMRDANDEVIYVGKASNLKHRVSSYFSKTWQSAKVAALVSHIADIEIVVTNNEKEALILESNLIKSLSPKYNIMLRDDKSYPYVYLSTHQSFPRLSLHRGQRKSQGTYFGPYPSAGAARETLAILQKNFPIRQCTDSYFKNRTRPCLQHQIKRCTAPCVNLISEVEYAADVDNVKLFLNGKNDRVVANYAEKMQACSDRLEFEKAADYRDKIASLRRIQETQYVFGDRKSCDVIACEISNGRACIQVFYIRDGNNLGNKAYFPKYLGEESQAAIIEAFIIQHYVDGHVPGDLLVNASLEDSELLEEALSEQVGKKINISRPQRGTRLRLMQWAEANAVHALQQKLNHQSSVEKRFEALAEALDLDDVPRRIECFDISHTGGEATVASCVVFDESGPLKSDYRTYNIRGITEGDDYAAMRQVLSRRYAKIVDGEGVVPDVVLIDGGKGQLNAAQSALDELNVSVGCIVGVSKGTDRKAGWEKLFLLGQKHPIILPADSMALHMIQQIRDEAHRFAISGHRQRRHKKRTQSVLEQIEQVGPKRRQALLAHFGGLQRLKAAGVEDIAKVPGISRSLAQTLYEALHQSRE